MASFVTLFFHKKCKYFACVQRKNSYFEATNGTLFFAVPYESRFFCKELFFRKNTINSLPKILNIQYIDFTKSEMHRS